MTTAKLSLEAGPGSLQNLFMIKLKEDSPDFQTEARKEHKKWKIF